MLKYGLINIRESYTWSLVCYGKFLLFLVPHGFSMKGYWILSKTFPAAIEIILWFCPWFFIWSISLITFHILNHSCIPWMKPAGSWCMVCMCDPRDLTKVYCTTGHTSSSFCCLFWAQVSKLPRLTETTNDLTQPPEFLGTQCLLFSLWCWVYFGSIL